MKRKRIVVAGSANTDVVLNMKKAPLQGESVLVQSQKFIPGGKGANRAVALARLGAEPLFSCCIGGDSFGRELIKLYKSERLDTSLISVKKDAPTGTAYIFVEENGKNRIAVSAGANGEYSETEIASLVSRFDETEMLSLELEIPVQAVEKLNYYAVKSGVPCVIDAGPICDIDKKIFKGAFILSPNESEARALTDISINNENSAKEACRALYSFGVKYALIKWGINGSVCFDGSEYIFSPAYKSAGEAVDTTAAGDCYMAALCKALCSGKKMRDAMRYAGIAAGISVTRRGAIPSLPYENEVEKLF